MAGRTSAFPPVQRSEHHWPQLFSDRALFTGAVLALAAELLAVRNFQRTFGGFNWISAAYLPLGLKRCVLRPLEVVGMPRDGCRETL
jgi:hypothetical protein